MDKLDIKKEFLRVCQDIGLINDEFAYACQNGNLDMVKYLLTSPDLTEHADIHVMGDYGFRYACRNGHLDVVKYLLTSPELTEHADIHVMGDYGFLWACAEGHLEVIKYLLTSPDLKEYADIHVYNDLGFQYAYNFKHLTIIKYLLKYNKDYQDKFYYEIKDLVNKGNIDLLPYLKSNKKEKTEECEIFI